MTSPNKLDERNELTPLRSAPLAGRDVPARVLLAPWGTVQSSNGNFVVDDESAGLTLEEFARHATDLPIDYEHQTLGGQYASPNGQAPAAGWIKRLFAEAGVGLLAEIEWTKPAQEQLAQKQYRYLSPVAIVRKSDRRLVSIHSAALTNKPAIVGMQPIVNRDAAGEVAAAMTKLRSELDLAADCCDEEVLVAATQRIDALQREQQDRHVEQRIGEAIRTGRLTDAQRDWAKAMILRDESLFDEWLATAPVVVHTGATAPPNSGDVQANRQRRVEATARAEFQANPLLARLTSEEAFVADAIRNCE